ncbi:HigA family addiction module antitoxin [Demequina soli]|uniref:HigA family addiction module antitoxin n=1 Tax=Demequina soli TaxID=1638987 RepID=UPI0007817908|nr:HigA family addiction module antitoxin [Demequina soli]
MGDRSLADALAQRAGIIADLEPVDRDTCTRLHVDDLATGPGVAVHLETGRVAITIDGGNFSADGATLDDAVTHLIAELRGQAARTHTQRQQATSTADSTQLMGFIERSSTPEIRAWLLPPHPTTPGEVLQAREGRIADEGHSGVADADTAGWLDPVTPGDVLRREFMEPLNLTVPALAAKSGIPVERLRAILDSQVRLARADCIALAAALGTSAHFWHNLQRLHDQAARR